MVCLLVEARKQEFRGKQGCPVEVEVERIVFKVMAKSYRVVDTRR
jgi:hypothetical protein